MMAALAAIISPAAAAVLHTTLDFFGRYLGGRADGLAKARADGTVAGVASTEAIER